MSKRTEHRRRKAAGLVKPVVKTVINEALFEEWSDHLAWLTGLIWSDGCLYKNTIYLSTKDFQLADLVLSLTDGVWGTKNQGQHLRVHFTSRKVADFFRSIGLTERKSLTAEWPRIPVEFENDFMRGMIDGDGSVLLSRNRPNQRVDDLLVQIVTASEKLCDGMECWMRKHGLRYSRTVRQPKPGTGYAPVWKLAVVHQESLRKLHGLLYPHENACCLHRKRIPFDVWMETPRFKAGGRYLIGPPSPSSPA